EMTVLHQLAGMWPGISQAQAVDHVIQARFKQAKQVRASQTGTALGFLEISCELALQDAVDTTSLLLLSKLSGILRKKTPARLGIFAVLARRVGTSFNGTLGGHAARPLEEQLFTFPATKLTDGSNITSQGFLHTPVCLHQNRIWLYE